MLFALLIFIFFVKENKWREDVSTYEINEEDNGHLDPINKKLTNKEKISLLLILFSVFFWYFGYNAVISKYSVYATNVLDMDYSATLLLANAAAVVAYLPIGYISSKLGRKKVILIGVALLSVSFIFASFALLNIPSDVKDNIIAAASIIIIIIVITSTINDIPFFCLIFILSTSLYISN